MHPPASQEPSSPSSPSCPGPTYLPAHLPYLPYLPYPPLPPLLPLYNVGVMRADIEHKQHAPRVVRCVVVTVSDTRTDATDTGGRAIADLLTAAGHVVHGRALVKDDALLVRATVEAQLADPEVDAVITTGGTGITSRDTTYEAIDALLDKRLDGFGELFRMLSYEQVGAAAMMSRATAGLARGHIVIALPGSEAAVRLAMEKLVLPEIGHMVQQARK